MKKLEEAKTEGQKNLAREVLALQQSAAKDLLSAKVDPNFTVKGEPLLSALIGLPLPKTHRSARIAMLKILLEGGADPNVYGADNKPYGAAPLAVAILDYTSHPLTGPLLEH